MNAQPFLDLNTPAPPKNAPTCGSCSAIARLTTGLEIYPHRFDLHEKQIWKCDGCGGYVGCHPGTTNPLGTPAKWDLRNARRILHNEMIDPLWKTADSCGLYTPEDEKARHKIRRSARGRVYGYLAQKLGMQRTEIHVGMFDIETCRRAWVALRGVTYPQIREWFKQQKETTDAS